MSSIRVAIIGVDPISASIALGLREHAEQVEVTGYDAHRAVADLARARGIFDKVRRKPGRACEGASLVIVSEPLDQIEATFAAISSHLEEGAFVTDTARLKAPVVRWAENSLPSRISFVGGHPVPDPAVVELQPLEGLSDARADLLNGALYCFTPSSRASDAEIEACSWLARALGAHPFFLGVTEHDGLQAGIEGLPRVLAIALLRATIDTPGWKEMRKFAGPCFASATEAVETAAEQHISLMLNRDSIVRRLDALIAELGNLRNTLADAEEGALAEMAAAAAEGRRGWIGERRGGMWGEEKASDTRDVPGAAQQLKRMVFGNFSPRPGRGSDDSQKP